MTEPQSIPTAEAERDHGTRVLIRGVDYSEWVGHKFEHARALTQKLRESFNEWQAETGPLSRIVRTSDPNRVDLVANIPNSPRVTEWSLLFGDIIHNYRSSLDALTWSLAHLDGAVPDDDDAQRIYFPLSKDEAHWEKLRKGALRSIPAFALNRLRSLQPWHGGDADKAIGMVLHKLDIEDKHRQALQLRVMFDPKAGISMLLATQPTDATGPGDDPVEFAAPGMIEDGSRLVTIRAQSQIHDASIEHLPLALTVQREGVDTHAFELLEKIDLQIFATFVGVSFGMRSEKWAQFLEGEGDCCTRTRSIRTRCRLISPCRARSSSATTPASLA